VPGNQHALQVATTAIRDDGFAVGGWMRVVPLGYFNDQKSRSVKYTMDTAQVQETRKQQAWYCHVQHHAPNAQGHCWAPHFGSLGDNTKYQQQYLETSAGATPSDQDTVLFRRLQTAIKRTTTAGPSQAMHNDGKHATKRLIAADSTALLQQQHACQHSHSY